MITAAFGSKHKIKIASQFEKIHRVYSVHFNKKHLHFEVKITVILDFDACVCVLALKSEMSLATEPKAS